MNEVLSAIKLMKAHEIVKRCAKAKKSPVLLKAMELEVKQKLYEMNRQVRT